MTNSAMTYSVLEIIVRIFLLGICIFMCKLLQIEILYKGI